MNVQSVNYGFDNYCGSKKNVAFNGIWTRIGQNYLNADHYCAGAFYKFADGKSLKMTHHPKNGRRLMELGMIDMTAEEGKLAYKFLFENLRDFKGFDAVVKLRNFILANTTKEGKHNIMFLEKEDLADVTAKRERLSIDRINVALRDYADKFKLPGKNVELNSAEQEKIMTEEELREYLRENGVA